MRGLLASSAAVLLASLVLAGCSGTGDPPADQPEDADFEDLGLQATATKGVLRGVVVDDAIRPVAGVAVSLTGPSTGNTTTTADGLFGFSDLEPGPYFVHAEKAGFVAAQSTADVVAGVDDPPVVKILLTADATTAPYVATFIFEGFIECSESFVAAGHATCSQAGLPNDKFDVTYNPDRQPQWIQSEMHWESTQAVSPGLHVAYSVPGEGLLLDNPVEAGGPSPLLLQANETMVEQLDVMGDNGLFIRVFNEPIEGTRPSDPVNGDDCLDRPALGGCANGVGVTIEQSFTIITNIFYGFAPDPAWRYAVDGPAAPPQ
jgi:Carboxypeptidase regulatory-like domain